MRLLPSMVISLALRFCSCLTTFAIAFSTAGRIAHHEKADIVPLAALNENRIDLPFRAAAEATQEAVLNAMLAAPETIGRDGNRRASLADHL